MKPTQPLNFQKGFVPILMLIALAVVGYIAFTDSGRELLSKIGINLGSYITSCTKNGESNYVEGDYFCSYQLGIKIKLSDEIKKQGLVFESSEKPSVDHPNGYQSSPTEVRFSTRELTSLYPNCGLDKSPALGAITRVNGTYDGPANTVKQLNGYYIVGQNQVTCTSDMMAAETYGKWIDLTKNLQPIK